MPTRLCIPSGSTDNVHHFFGISRLDLDDLSTHVPHPMCGVYFSLFPLRYNSVSIDNGPLSTVVNEGSHWSLGEHPVLSETAEGSVT